MKTFDALYAELQGKAAFSEATGNTRRLLDEGVHAIGKKVVEEAAEAWMAAEHEDNEALAIEISQLIYHLQTLMLARGLTLQDIYKNLYHLIFIQLLELILFIIY